MRKEIKQEKIRKGYCSDCIKVLASPGYMTCEGCRRRRKISQVFRRLPLGEEVNYLLERENNGNSR